MANSESAIELSERELQVLHLVVTGASNQEIARHLVISINTVKVHLRNIFTKLEVQSRTEATLRAIQEGLVTISESTEDAAETGDPAAPFIRTYLIEATPPLALPQWQQLYLAGAALLALLLAILPLIPAEQAQEQLKLPSIIIYDAAPPAPAPPVQTNSSSNRWISRAPMPSRRAGLALATFDQKIFAIGGTKENNSATRLVEIYDAATNTWTEGDSKPTATTDVSAAVLNDQIYIPGGCTDQHRAVKTLEIYDPKTDRWVEGPALPEARCAYGLVAFQDKLYLFGGRDDDSFKDTIFIFSPTKNKWDISESRLPQPLGYFGVAVLEEQIYLAGGYNGEEEFATTYAFDPATGKWQPKAALNEKRGGLGLISSNKNLFAIGGGWDNTLDSSEKYDPKTDTWTTFESPSVNQWRNLGLATIDTTIYAVGGWNGDDKKFMNTLVSYQFLHQLFMPISISQ